MTLLRLRVLMREGVDGESEAGLTRFLHCRQKLEEVWTLSNFPRGLIQDAL